MISPPVWFNDKEAAPIRELMTWFVRQLDQRPYDQRARGLRRQLSASTMPAQLQRVYGHGFTGSAGRARSLGATAFFYSGCESEIGPFERIWFGLSESIPVYFWGDLDFSAIGIIKALRQAFPALEAWQPGYAPMVKELQRGGGHEPSLAGKVNQLNPGLTGCGYTDTVLLPLLADSNRYLDQEWITLSDL